MMCTFLLTVIYVLADFCHVIRGRDYEEPCGAILSNSEGSFNHTIINRKPTANTIRCLWVIKNMRNKVIKLQISDLDVHEVQFCYSDRIEVEDEHKKLGVICGKRPVAPMFTRTSIMYVMSVLDPAIAKDFKFSATYRIEDHPKKYCGGHLNQTSGWLTSLDRDGDTLYDANLDCSWVIKAKQFNVIIVRFSYFDVDETRGCKEDYVEIKDDGTLVGRFCGGRLPPITTSRTNLVRIRFHTDYKDQGKGFNATYFQTTATTIMCGGVVSKAVGMITSPGEYSDVMYYEKHECLWVIDAEEKKCIDFEILQMQIGESIKCQEKSVSIYDDETKFGVFCGDDPPTVITSFANYLYVRFQSTDNFHSAGFNARYTQKYVFNEDCGGYLNDSRGVVAYQRTTNDTAETPVDCFWVIETQTGKEIEFEINVLETLETFPCKDYLLIYDTISPKVKMCGSRKGFLIDKNPVRSISNKLFIQFYSADPTAAFRGKYRVYEALDKPCGGLFNESSGFVTSPDEDFNAKYDYNLDCLYEFRARPSFVISLHFEVLDLEPDPKCSYDYIEVYGYIGEESEILCGQFEASRRFYRLSRSNTFYVHLVTDGSYNLQGFRIVYKEVLDISKSCDVFMNDTSGNLAPVNISSDIFLTFINKRQNEIDCIYTIQVPTGLVVQIPPFKVYMEDSFGCQQMFLEIDGTGKFCATIRTPLFQSKSNTVYIHYKIHQRHRAYFNITYVSRQDLTKTIHTDLKDVSGLISVPEDESKLLCNHEYSWRITAGDKHVVLFEVNLIQLIVLVRAKSDDLFQAYEGHRLLFRIYDSAGPCKNCASFATEYTTLDVLLRTDQWTLPKHELLEASYTIVRENPFCSLEYKCLGASGNITISHTKLCDNIPDCPYEDDERFCDSRCLPNCTCMGLLQDCTGKMSCNVSLNATIPAFYRNNTFLPMRVLDVSTNSYWFHTFEWKQSILFGFLEQLNISSCEITDLPDNFFLYLGSLKILDLSYNVLRHLQIGLFKYLTELELLLLNGNSAILDIDSEVFGGSCSLPNLKMEYLHIGKISSKAFSGLKLKTLQFSYAVIDYIEENAFSELSVNEVYLNATKVISSSDLLFEGIRNVTHMKTYSYRFCCLLPSYLSKTTCIPKPESTTRCHDLLGQEKYMLWIAAIVSSFTNILSFRRHFAFDRTNHRFGHYFFLSNLAVSDFLMSVYDILITGADISFSGVYASVRDDWLKGTWCSFAAVISLCSVIASSLFVCLIAVGRFLVIRFPSGEMHFTRKLSLCIICLIWLFAAGVSTIPSLFSTTTKTDGVCFGLDYDHEPSIEMIFASCVLMCAALTIFVLTIMGSWNIEIERKATKANLIRARQMRKTDLRTSRNILVLAAIDAVCLLVTALLRLPGIGIEAYMSKAQVTMMTIIILSVLAAMNPLMYNLSAWIGLKEFSPNIEEQERQILCSREEYDRILSLMTNPRYWKRGWGHRSFKRLSMILDRGAINKKTGALVAYGIVARIVGLHHIGLTQSDLMSRDVLVNKSFRTGKVKVVMICRPKLIINSSEKYVNIEEIGIILTELVDKLEGKPKETKSDMSMKGRALRFVRLRRSK